MEEHFEAGQGGWTAQLNGVIQASTRSAYHKSGGKITPGSSATTLTVAVASGAANVGGKDVEWAGTELELADGGIGPSGRDTGNPRVDAIFAAKNGALGVATGDPAPYAPDTDPQGNPYTPAPFEHWSPAPDSGSRIGGCVLGFVVVEPAMNSADDLPAENIQQWKIGVGIEGTAFVRGDGQPNGPTVITVTDDPVTIEDEANSRPPFFAYDPQNETLTLGGDGARATLGSQLDTNNVRFLYDSSTSGSSVSFFDQGTDSAALVFGAQVVGYRKDLDLSDNEIVKGSRIHSEEFRFRDGEARIFASSTPNNHLIYVNRDGNTVDLTPNL